MSAWNKIQSWLNQELAAPSSAAPPATSISDAVPASEAPEGERTVAWMLRTFGQESFDLETGSPQDQRHGWELWAAKIESGRRDWPELKAFVERQRKQECEFVNHNVKGLRGTLWDLLQRLGRSVAQDAAGDGSMPRQLQCLRVVVEEKSVEEIRREVLSAVETMGTLLHERQERQRRDMEESVRQLGAVRQDLSKSRREMAQDPLTRLYNRASFDEQLQAFTALGNLTGEPCTLVIADVDGFKSLRGQLGRSDSDEVLRQISDALTRAYPRRTDFVARHGEAVFAALLPDTGNSGAVAAAQRAVDTVHSQKILLGEKEIQASLSVGAATLRRGETPKQWLERAAKACRAAQADSGNQAKIG